MSNTTTITTTQFQQYRIILTASSGRCGTNLLAKLLNLCPGVVAEHEPLPYVDNVWWRTRTDPTIAAKWLVKHKLPVILNRLHNAGANTYVETSHMLCKGFFEPLMDLNIGFDLIILSRDLRQTALSFYHLNDVPGRSKTGRRWLPSPQDPDCISGLPKDDNLTDYQICYWYVLEMELRKAMYRKTWTTAGVSVVDIMLDDLLIKSRFRQFLSNLALPEPIHRHWHDYKLLTLIKHNIKTTRKSFLKRSGVVSGFQVKDADTQEQDVRTLIKYEELLEKFR